MIYPEEPEKSPPLLIVLSGPSGVGKDIIISLMRKRFPSFYIAVTATTRPRREKESNGVDYFFVSRETFLEMVKKEELLEWSEVYGNYYGVPLNQVRQALQRDQDTVLKVDVQGAEKIKARIPEAILIFVAPPSHEALVARLRGRKTEKAEELKIRLETSQKEMKAMPIFNYAVVNAEGKIEETLKQIEAIITKEKQRVNTAPRFDSSFTPT